MQHQSTTATYTKVQRRQCKWTTVHCTSKTLVWQRTQYSVVGSLENKTKFRSVAKAVVMCIYYGDTEKCNLVKLALSTSTNVKDHSLTVESYAFNTDQNLKFEKALQGVCRCTAR